MKKVQKTSLLLFLCMAFFSFSEGGKYETLKIGDTAPMQEKKMKSTKNSELALKDLKGEKGMLVIFSCNTCPFVLAWEDRYAYLSKLTTDHGMGFALINSNEAKRNGDDSMEEMVAHAKDKGYPDIAYLVDNNSALANAFGAKATPHVFLFDENWNLVYEGAIDDNHKDIKGVQEQYLNQAIENLANGKKIEPENTKAIGCSIKRVAG